VKNVIEMNKSDLQTAIRQQLQLQETNEFKQNAYYKRFEELRLTEGSGKLLKLFGKSCAIYNQNANGITTSFTLRNIKTEGRAKYGNVLTNDGTSVILHNLRETYTT
jgi:hypothetical protein